MGSLSVGHHAGRRAIYEPILGSNVAHVSPCYPYRGMKEGETDDAYVARLAQELEDTFQSLGPDTVCAFVAETVAGMVFALIFLPLPLPTDTSCSRPLVACLQPQATYKP